MTDKKVCELPVFNQWLWGFGGLGYALMERLLITYAVFFYLLPSDYGVHDLVTRQTYFGIFTIMGLAILMGRLVDGISDPLVATLSDRTKSKLGRRKPFLLVSALPMCTAAVLVFYPPFIGETSMLNGLWAASLWLVFYVFFTGYITPYFSLISELGHTNSLRINFGTIHALFAILGMVIATIIFPLLVTAFREGGMDVRPAYQFTALIFGAIALVSLYITAFSYDEKKHCHPAEAPISGMWSSMKSILSISAFRTFLIGELLLQFAIFMLNLGLAYYVTVLFGMQESFLTILGGVLIGVALISFPIVNKMSKKIGKKKPIILGVVIMFSACFTIYIVSFNMTDFGFYIALAMFGLGGITLASCTILTLPVYADLAREESLRTGVKREAMFYASRNLPLKFTIALAGVCFAYLLSDRFDEFFGIQLSILFVAIFSLLSLFFFLAYPEKKVEESLQKHEMLNE